MAIIHREDHLYISKRFFIEILGFSPSIGTKSETSEYQEVLSLVSWVSRYISPSQVNKNCPTLIVRKYCLKSSNIPDKFEQSIHTMQVLWKIHHQLQVPKHG